MKNMVQVRRGGGRDWDAPDVRIGRSQFNRSCGRKMTFNTSYLYPVFINDIMPGDTMTMKVNGFCRIFSPLKSPIMDNLTLDLFWFYCPTRLLWSNWEYFNGAHDDAGAQDTTYTIPIMADGITVDHDQDSYGDEDLMACLGIPDGLQTTQVPVNALPLRMYNRVYNEFFRDQNLIDELTMSTGNGPDTAITYGIWKSAKKHDYFTSCLPYLQKGTASAVGMQGMVDVRSLQVGDATDAVAVYSNPSTGYYDLKSDAADLLIDSSTAATDEALFVDLSITSGTTGATTPSIDINALRQSIAIQRLLEKDARGGTRYTEIIKTHFGVTSPDFRLQRPEFLGGGKTLVNVTPIANTADTEAAVAAGGADVYQGELRGVGTAIVNGMGFAKSFTEHGYLMGLVRVRGDITYFQGLDRLWSRSTRYDFYIPSLANLGEQSVLNKELWISNSSATDTAVFGYQERWSEYRTKKSELVGLFNPDASGALSHWHLAEDFGSLPALNQTFIQDTTPMSRVISSATGPDFLLDLWYTYKCARPIPVNSVPSLTARF